MTRTFVIGDIHGGLKALREVLKKASVQKEDQLIFLGDYVDGWSESPQVLDFLIELNQQQDCIFIRGNHDDLLMEYLKTGHYSPEWFLHGGESTVKAYRNQPAETLEKHMQFLEQLLDFHLDEQNRLFIHAGFTNVKGVPFEYFKKMFFWDRSLWETALSLDPNLPESHPHYPNRLKIYKEIYIGHTPTTRIGLTIPVHKNSVWNIDTGAAFKGPLTLMEIESKKYYQSRPLPEWYPDEKGRN